MKLSATPRRPSPLSIRPLLGSRCQHCDARYFPPLRICPTCYRRDLSECELAASGRVYSYSILHVGPPGIESPYALAYVDLSDGVRVLARVADWEEGIACDEEVALVGQEPGSAEVVAYLRSAMEEAR